MEKPMTIWNHYFEPAADILSGSGFPANVTAKIYHECAMFADRQYHAITRSPDTIRRKLYVDRKVNEIRDLESQIRRGGANDIQDLKHTHAKAQRQLNADRESYARHIEALKTFLQQAVKMYAYCLEVSYLFDDDAHIRLVSLWYANFDDEKLMPVLNNIHQVPSWKFLFLTHQLTARLTKLDSGPTDANRVQMGTSRPSLTGQEHLQKLVLRMCIEHPFHSLYQLFPLKSSSDTSISANKRHSQRLDASQPLLQKERAAAAAELFNKLRNGPNAVRVRDVDEYCKACLEWAKYSVKELANRQSRKDKSLPVPKTMQILRLDFAKGIRVPIPTAYTPVDPTMQYNNCVWIKGYEDTFKTAGGVNVPKIHRCFGTDGSTHTQLVRPSFLISFQSVC
jgi:serine-protein kinase ATM